MSVMPNAYSPSNLVRKTLKSLFFLRQAPKSASAAEQDGKRLVHLGDIAADIVANLRVIFVYLLLSLLAAFVYLSLSTPRYSVTVQLIPIPSWLRSEPMENSQPLTSLLGGEQETGLYSIFTRAIGIKDIFISLDRKFAARQHYFRNQWDAVNHTWVSPPGLPGLLRHVANGLRSMTGMPVKAGPTIDDLRKYLIQNIEITVNEDHSIRAEMKSTDPAYDAQVLQYLIGETDRVVRGQMLAYVNASVSAMQAQLASQTDSAIRSSLIDKLARDMARRADLQGSRIMTLNLNNVEVSDVPVYPSFLATIVVFLMIGLLVPLAVIFFRRLLV